MTTTGTQTLTATMTNSTEGVHVTLTDEAGTVVETFTTKESGKFVARLDKMMVAAGFARSGYTAANGALFATVRDYRPR